MRKFVKYTGRGSIGPCYVLAKAITYIGSENDGTVLRMQEVDGMLEVCIRETVEEAFEMLQKVLSE